jgi:hypothetical protein
MDLNYNIINEPIKKDDWMLINNPQSDKMRNVVKQCNTVMVIDGVNHYSFFIVTDEVTGNGHHSGYYPERMCKRIELI